MKKYLLMTCGALALTAGTAQAATVVDMETSGIYSTSIVPGSTLSLNGSASGNIYHDLAPVRDYTVTFSGLLDSVIPTTAIPFSGSFTWTGSIASLATITPFDSVSGFLSSVLGSGTYSGLTFTDPAFSVDYALELVSAIAEDFVAATGSYSGNYTMSATLTAPVPLPATLGLGLAGLGLMGFAGRRRKNKAEGTALPA